MKKLIYCSVPLWLLLFVAASYISYQNTRDYGLLASIKPVKVNAREHGLITITESLPNKLSFQGTTVKIKPKKIMYPRRLPVLEIQRESLSETHITRWFKPDDMTYRGESSSTAYLNEQSFTSVERTWDMEGPEPGIATLDDRGTLTFNRRLKQTEWSYDPAGDDHDQIEEDVASYIRAHGGIPADAFVESAWERPYHNPTKYGPKGSYFKVVYRHSYKGIPIFDDLISVQYCGVVVNYTRRWSSLKETGADTIMRPKRAIEIALKENSARLEQSKEKLAVDAIWLVYFEPGLRDTAAARKQPAYRPGWAVRLNNGTDSLVDAVTGTGYPLSAPRLGHNEPTIVYELY